MKRLLVVLLFAASVGCGALQESLPPALPQPEEPSITYRLELVDPARPLVRIELVLRGDEDGETELELEDWGGIEDAGAELELSRTESDTGEGLASERLDTGLWRIRHVTGESLRIAFDLGPTRRRTSAEPREYYRPILEPGLLHLIGSNALPAPKHMAATQERSIRLEWRGFERAGWRTLSSFAPDGRDQTLIEALDGFRHALFLAGDLRVFEREVHDRPVLISVSGYDWATSPEDFADLCAEIVALEREFFEDFDHRHYLISLIPVGEKNPSVVSMGGTGLTNSFALFLQPGARLDRGPTEDMSIPWLLAHEMFHEWNGQAIRLSQPERLGYWFSEGFTDFYTRRLLYRAGFLSREEYLASWNHRLSEYASNPERNAPATRIEAAFWTNADVQSLPYQRGDVVALFVDHAIARASGGRSSLDDLMRELVRRAQKGESDFSVDELLGLIAGFAGLETAEAVRGAVVDGASLQLPGDLGAPEFELESVEVQGFELGFDFERTRTKYVVCGVVGGSAAEAAGLRDGMQVRSLSFYSGRADVPVEIKVFDGGGERMITFLPQGRPVDGYRLDLRNELEDQR